MYMVHFSKSIAYRFNGSYENSESFRNMLLKSLYYAKSFLLFKVSNKTEITLQADYLGIDWTPDFFLHYLQQYQETLI